MVRIALASCLLLSFGVLVADEPNCVGCHEQVTPSIVTDWKLSEHGKGGIDCSVCHGDGHTTADDVAEVTLPTPEICAACHEQQVEQYGLGKHALAWASMKAMPNFHWQPMELTEGMKGCGGCHKIGIKGTEEIRELKTNGSTFGVASCDACHTRHLFSAEEARQPQACQTCHMGFDHPQWEMYSSSKHGVRRLLKQVGILPTEAAAPSCQDCHMSGGDHEVRTAWGFLAVRTPLVEDPEWVADRVTILQALGVLDGEGKPTARMEVVRQLDMARLDEESFRVEREKMLAICGECHSTNFADGELRKGDDLIRAADHLMAQAIREIADLYKDGLLTPPESCAGPFPDLLTFHDAPTVVEQRLFVMFFKHRMRTFQGAFHANPDYALWYGWSEMQRDLTEIQETARELRERGKPPP